MTDTPRTTRSPADQAWVDAFVVELRLRDVPGGAIGAALAEVDAHCADAACGPRDAFGDPVAYARELELPRAPLGRRDVLGAVAPGLAATVGVALLLGGVWPDEGVVRVTAGWALGLGLTLAGIVAVGIFDAPLRVLVTGPFWRGWALLTAGLALVVLPGVTWRAELTTLPRGVALGVGAALVVAAATALVRLTRSAADPVVPPLRG